MAKTGRNAKAGTPPSAVPVRTKKTHHHEFAILQDLQGDCQRLEPEKKRVKEKKKMPLQRHHPPRRLPNALLIRAKDGNSLADMLQRVKSDKCDKEIYENIEKVRRLSADNLLIVLNKKTQMKR